MNKHLSTKLPTLTRLAPGIPPAASAGRDPRREPNGYFMLKIKGDAMQGDGIFDGDRVVFKRQFTASNGQTIVARINKQAAIKKYFKRNDKIELVPANPLYETITVHSSEDFKIEGILAGVIRKIS